MFLLSTCSSTGFVASSIDVIEVVGAIMYFLRDEDIPSNKGGNSCFLAGFV